ncbi:hypothetical protein JCM19240_6393 [Vibrio maritimus]|uniref:Uncharacterized protein n=1 Tax=Vibrio maritimus TaxID=990268 RepID=A0A090SZ77_9VIBR|nr:hypothetical protein JCM19240_6393 [Vibrio maritimus]
MKYISAIFLGGMLALSMPTLASDSSTAGPYVECQLTDGSRTFTPIVLCERAGGKRLF